MLAQQHTACMVVRNGVVAKKKRMEREEPETQLATNDATIKYELGT